MSTSMARDDSWARLMPLLMLLLEPPFVPTLGNLLAVDGDADGLNAETAVEARATRDPTTAARVSGLLIAW